MKAPPDLHRFIEALKGIDSGLTFEEQVEEAAQRTISFLMGDRPPAPAASLEQAAAESALSLTVQYDYPYLSTQGPKTARAAAIEARE